MPEDASEVPPELRAHRAPPAGCISTSARSGETRIRPSRSTAMPLRPWSVEVLRARRRCPQHGGGGVDLGEPARPGDDRDGGEVGGRRRRSPGRSDGGARPRRAIQRRDRVLDVATPPPLTASVHRTPSAGSACSTRTSQPASVDGRGRPWRGRRRCDTSAPCAPSASRRATARSAASPLPMPPGSSASPGGTVTMPPVGSSSSVVDRGQVRRRAAPGRSTRDGSSRLAAYPCSTSAGSTVGSKRPPVIWWPSIIDASSVIVESSTASPPPGVVLMRLMSLFGMNRLQHRSRCSRWATTSATIADVAPSVMMWSSLAITRPWNSLAATGRRCRCRRGRCLTHRGLCAERDRLRRGRLHGAGVGRRGRRGSDAGAGRPGWMTTTTWRGAAAAGAVAAAALALFAAAPMAATMPSIAVRPRAVAAIFEPCATLLRRAGRWPGAAAGGGSRGGRAGPALLQRLHLRPSQWRRHRWSCRCWVWSSRSSVSSEGRVVRGVSWSGVGGRGACGASDQSSSPPPSCSSSSS